MSIDVTRTIAVSRKAMDDIRIAGKAADPLEACGLLLGREDRSARVVTKAVEARNVHPTPLTHFEIEPQALINAYRDERGGGLRLLGYFHSHPNGNPAPSRTDQAQAARDGRIWAIVTGDDLRLFQDDPDGFAPAAFAIVDD